MIENQEELRNTLEKNRELKELIKQLETQASKQDVPPSETNAQQEELQTHVRHRWTVLKWLPPDRTPGLWDSVGFKTFFQTCFSIKFMPLGCKCKSNIMVNGIYDENADALLSTGDVSFLLFCFMQLLIFNREGVDSPVYTV